MMQRKTGGRIRRALGLVQARAVDIIMFVVAVLWLIPTVGLFVQSLRTGADIGQSGWWTALANPRTLTLNSYIRLLNEPTMLRALKNTFIITIPSTILVVGVAALAAYALAWIPFKGREALFLVIVGLQVVPTQMAFIPAAQIFRFMGIFGTVQGVICFHLAFGLPFAIFLLRNFLGNMPKALLEAAQIDGAGHLVLFLRVLLPLTVPAIASLSIFQFLWVWNDMMIALIFAEPVNAPLTTAIYSQMRNFASNVDVIAPGAFLQMVVPLIIFFVFQRQLVQGILGGSIKD
ncbi:MAG TPA: carbohydrate ABC transporter permease [Firmicutes bacterium]|jgi:alpha-glucoside transport system permease protein|nr:carbohydrate ABC transporter permease [Bacillota bacterium]